MYALPFRKLNTFSVRRIGQMVITAIFATGILVINGIHCDSVCAKNTTTEVPQVVFRLVLAEQGGRK